MNSKSVDAWNFVWKLYMHAVVTHVGPLKIVLQEKTCVHTCTIAFFGKVQDHACSKRSKPRKRPGLQYYLKPSQTCLKIVFLRPWTQTKMNDATEIVSESHSNCVENSRNFPYIPTHPVYTFWMHCKLIFVSIYNMEKNSNWWIAMDIRNGWFESKSNQLI